MVHQRPCLSASLDPCIFRASVWPMPVSVPPERFTSHPMTPSSGFVANATDFLLPDNLRCFLLEPVGGGGGVCMPASERSSCPRFRLRFPGEPFFGGDDVRMVIGVTRAAAARAGDSGELTRVTSDGVCPLGMVDGSFGDFFAEGGLPGFFFLPGVLDAL